MTEARLIHLVDDDEAVRHSASFMLRHAGFAVKTYTDGVAFLDEATSAAPGCILLDVQMPRMDGLEVQEQLNTLGITLPVIVLTGHATLDAAVEAFRRHADDFFAKPVKISDLKACVQKLLGENPS